MKMLAKLTLAMKFLLNFFNIAMGKLINLWVSNTPPSATTVELDSNQPVVVISNIAPASGGQHPDQGNHGTDAGTMLWIELPLILIGVCVAVVSAALQAAQLTGPLPLKSQLVCAALVMFITFVLASIYLRVRRKYKSTSDALLHVGAFLGATALVGALVINMNTPLMVVSLAIFLSGIFVVIIACF